MTDKVKLKPCPFCGSEAREHIGSIKNSCLCPNEKCILFARIISIEDWNTRPIEDKLKEYIQHKVGCLKRTVTFGKHECTCGLEELL